MFVPPILKYLTLCKIAGKFVCIVHVSPWLQNHPDRIPDSNVGWAHVGPTSVRQYWRWSNVEPTYIVVWDPSVMPPGTSIGCYAPLWRHKSHRRSHIFTYSSPRKECSVKHRKFNWWYGRLCWFGVVFNCVTQLQVNIHAILHSNCFISKTPRRHNLCKLILCMVVKRSMVTCVTKRT